MLEVKIFYSSYYNISANALSEQRRTNRIMMERSRKNREVPEDLDDDDCEEVKNTEAKDSEGEEEQGQLEEREEEGDESDYIASPVVNRRRKYITGECSTVFKIIFLTFK